MRDPLTSTTYHEVRQASHGGGASPNPQTPLCDLRTNISSIPIGAVVGAWNQVASARTEDQVKTNKMNYRLRSVVANIHDEDL